MRSVYIKPDSHNTLVNMTATNVQPGIWTYVSPSCMKEGWEDETMRERGGGGESVKSHTTKDDINI